MESVLSQFLHRNKTDYLEILPLGRITNLRRNLNTDENILSTCLQKISVTLRTLFVFVFRFGKNILQHATFKLAN